MAGLYGSTSASSDTTVTVDPQVVSNYLSSLSDYVPGAPVSFIGNLNSTFDLNTSAGIVDPGSSVSVDAHVSASLYVGDNSTVDFSSSKADNGRPVALNITLGGGNNTITLNKGPSVIFSTSGDDTMKSSGGRDTIYGGTGHDSMVGGGRSAMVGGTYGGDTMVGGAQAGAHDTMVSGGSSQIKVSVGNNLILGGANDTIKAGASKSEIDLAGGAATVRGGNGSTIYGSGQSSIVGGGNNNTLNLTSNDTLVGGSGANTVNIADGSQASIQGGTGHLDVNMSSTSGNDTMFGGSGGLTIHVSSAMGNIVNDPSTLDTGGAHVVQFASGVTLHVSNVTFEFSDGQHRPV